jgi:predicted phage terminase large subunit-like protein
MNDYSVFQCWGYTITKQAVLLDMVRGKWEAPDLLVQARAFWNKHAGTKNQGALRAMKVEDKASGTGLIQTLKREGIPILDIQRNIDKVTRALDAAPYIESGNVILPQQASWLSDYLSEFSAFPNGAHDDMVDPTMDAIAEIHGGGVRPSIRAL